MAPRVTALVAEPRDRVRVELDGEPWRSVPAAAVVAARLAVGTELDRPRARTLRRELRRVEALAIATGALSRRDHSAASLAARLERRGVTPRERASALETLERAGYVDDSRFAAARASVLAARDLGDEAIRRDLERHGVASAEIEAALSGLPSEEERARAHVSRFGAGPKTARRLASKGFSSESVESAFGSGDCDTDWDTDWGRRLTGGTAGARGIYDARMPRTRGTWAIWLTLAALVWSVTILVAAFTAAAYQGETMTSNGQSFRTSATFVETNGASAAWLLTIPLLLTVATGVGLRLRHTRGSGAATTLAWSSVALLLVFSVLGAASVGVLILPVALLLGGAAALTSPGPRAPARAALRGR